MTSVHFLDKIESRSGGLEQFERIFGELGYSTLFVSDYYGLRPLGDDKVEQFLQRTFANCQKFEQQSGITPKLILDIEGFRIGKNSACRALVHNNKYVSGYHVFDEPDAHLTGDKNVWARTPQQIDEMCGTLGPFEKPIWCTFENQAGKPHARKWNYVYNTDEKYHEYMRAVAKNCGGKAIFGVDYYLFNRSLTPPTNQVSSFEMMRYFANLVWRFSPQCLAMSWCEPTLQKLGYMMNHPENKSRAVTPAEMRAQGWLFWAGGQRGYRGDFSYDPVPSNPDGLAKPEYAETQKEVQRLNQEAKEFAEFLKQPAIYLWSNSDKVAFSAWLAQGKILFTIVNLSDQPQYPMLLAHPAAHDFGEIEVIGENRVVQFDSNGLLLNEALKPYEVRLLKHV